MLLDPPKQASHRKLATASGRSGVTSSASSSRRCSAGDTLPALGQRPASPAVRPGVDPRVLPEATPVRAARR
eukprot:3494143-Lingulodinium_polyedra.AAC.1